MVIFNYSYCVKIYIRVIFSEFLGFGKKFRIKLISVFEFEYGISFWVIFLGFSLYS